MTLFDELARCRKWIEDAMARGDDTHGFDDIAGGVLVGRFHLWAYEDSAIITEFIDTPRKRFLHVFLAGGNLDRLKAAVPDLEQFGRAHGCTTISATGRKGWHRALGWNGGELAMTSKEIEHV